MWGGIVVMIYERFMLALASMSFRQMPSSPWDAAINKAVSPSFVAESTSTYDEG